ncbi:MAG: class I SAM-dependent methyltransferase [Pseudomonadota bacterium]
MPDKNHASLMDAIYRSQRHIYDVSRKYYLLGRDAVITDLGAQEGERVLEVGCGTGRNLIKAAKRYPKTHFFGFDISEEMLRTARKKVAAAGLSDRITLSRGDATDFSPQALFDVENFDHIFYSYTLSMIPPWEMAIEQGIKALSSGGQIHIVDFGQQEKLPGWFRTVLLKWLALFHVEPRKTLNDTVNELAERYGLNVDFVSRYKGYTWNLRLSSIS